VPYALYQSCRAVRQSPAVNSYITTIHSSDGESLEELADAWPRYAGPVKKLHFEGLGPTPCHALMDKLRHVQQLDFTNVSMCPSTQKP
jgi:hypothetical protein